MADGTCSIEGCARTGKIVRGWCMMHYKRWIAHGDPTYEAPTPTPRPCHVDGCDREAEKRDWCDIHYQRWKRTGDPTGREGGHGKVVKRAPAVCAAEDCDAPRTTSEWCDKHYKRVRKYGDPSIVRERAVYVTAEERAEGKRQYRMDRYYRLRAKAFELLGGVCVVCGTTEQLETDHIDRTTKSFDVSSMMLRLPWSNIEAELAKCQLLCHRHHLDKTLTEATKHQHGTLRMYQHGKCRCRDCSSVHRAYALTYNAANPRRTCGICSLRTVRHSTIDGIVMCHKCVTLQACAERG